ncbi:MAG: hypothetical protein ABIB71_02980 [Candidatus Woesearchaeota archaeon]
MKEPLHIEDIVVGMGDYAKVDCPDNAHVEGVAPCIGFAIYDTEKKFAYVGHLIPDATVTLEEAVKKAVEECSSVSNLKVAVVGNVIETRGEYLGRVDEEGDTYEKYVENANQTTSKIREILAKSGIDKKRIRAKVGRSDVDSYDLHVSTREGTISIEEVIPEFDLTWY